MNSIFNSYCFKSLSMYWEYTRHSFVQYMNDITCVVMWGIQKSIYYLTLSSFIFSLTWQKLIEYLLLGIILLQKVTNIIKFYLFVTEGFTLDLYRISFPTARRITLISEPYFSSSFHYYPSVAFLWMCLLMAHFRGGAGEWAQYSKWGLE